MNFGVWTVTELGVVNTKNPFNRIFFTKTSLERTVLYEGKEVYEALLVMSKLEKLSTKSLRVLNHVFLYAMGKFSLNLNLEVFEASLTAQASINAIKRINQLAK